MSLPEWVAIGAAAWLTIACAVALVIGRAASDMNVANGLEGRSEPQTSYRAH